MMMMYVPIDKIASAENVEKAEELTVAAPPLGVTLVLELAGH